MKKTMISLILLLVFPIMVRAETLTYSVCTGGGDFDRCDYSNLKSLQMLINSLEDLSDKDIIVNITSETNNNDFVIGSEDKVIKSVTINGNNHRISTLEIYTDTFEINDAAIQYDFNLFNSKKIKINNTSTSMIAIFYINGEQVSNDNIYLNDVLEIDDASLNDVDMIYLAGNIKIENMNFKNTLIENAGGTLDIYNSQFGKVFSVGAAQDGISNVANTNIYNSTFDSLKYFEIKSMDEFMNEFNPSAYLDTNDYSSFISNLNYDIYDANMTVDGGEMHSNTTVYFDKTLEIKTNEIINLKNILDYYTDDKEINYVIEDESIAKIDGLNLTGLKEGQTNITVTTDDGHVVYRIKLNIISKTIEIPITGIKVKPLVLLGITLLFVIIGGCIYILSKSKKSK